MATDESNLLFFAYLLDTRGQPANVETLKTELAGLASPEGGEHWLAAKVPAVFDQLVSHDYVEQRDGDWYISEKGRARVGAAEHHPFRSGDAPLDGAT